MKTKLFNIKPQATVILSYLLLALFFVGCSEDECQSTPINANEETEIFIERLESIITDIKSLRDESTYGDHPTRGSINQDEGELQKANCQRDGSYHY